MNRHPFRLQGQLRHPAHQDALILREDFEVQAEQTSDRVERHAQGHRTGSRIDCLHDAVQAPFHRETANWTPQKVAELVQSFLEGNLIPAVIFWRSPGSGNILVIDGAHQQTRLDRVDS